jgi:hypothetical protein
VNYLNILLNFTIKTNWCGNKRRYVIISGISEEYANLETAKAQLTGKGEDFVKIYFEHYYDFRLYWHFYRLGIASR